MKRTSHGLDAVFIAAFLIVAFYQTATADPPEKPGNPGVPGLLAEISDLKAQIAELEAIIEGYENLAPVPKTGQTTLHEFGDDGDLQKGLPWPDPRFTDNEDGTVTDNLTRLIWLKDANRFGMVTWSEALEACNNLGDDGIDLKDGSVAGDWRLPTIRELQSLIHYGVHDPALPNTNGTGKWSEGDPFTGVLCDVTNCDNGYYWSSSTAAGSGDAFYMYLGGGFVRGLNKSHDGYLVWPVRDAK